MVKYILFCITACSLLTACQKTMSTGDAQFDVQVNATQLSLGDTAIFSFGGSPDIITFYSGEVGKRYEYRSRFTAEGTPLLRFRTIRANGAQDQSLSILVSNDFAGILLSDTPATLNQIKAANWANITSRAQLSSGGTTAVSSGNIDLSDFSAQNKPVYLAFQYQGFAGSAQSKWTVDSFTVKNILKDGTSYEIANMNANNIAYTNYGVSTFSPGFFPVRVVSTYWWTVNSNSLVITGATGAGSAAPAESWAIIGPIDLKKVTPDIGLKVKNSSQKADELKLSYQYLTAGTYNAVFSGGRVSIDETQLSTKSFQITVQ